MENNYYWRLKWLAKGVDPLEAVNELRRLQELYAQLTPEIIVDESEDPDSVLHPIFEWNNDKAAYNYRIQQARILLNNVKLSVITDGESREVSVYEVTSLRDGYKNIETFSNKDIEFVKGNIIYSLNVLKKKLKLYREFDKVLEYINKAIEVIN